MSRYAAYRIAFEGLAAGRISPLVRRLSRARGLIFTLHRVLPEPPAAFAPNSILQVTPDFLEAAICAARDKGFDIVTLDEALLRVRAKSAGRPFVVFTFDDGYRDNREHALPILRKHKAPFTLYVPTALVDGTGDVWWQALEDIVAGNEAVTVDEAAGSRSVPTATLEQKRAFYDSLYWTYRKMPEPERVAAMHALAGRHGIDMQAHCRALIMDWDELGPVAADPLCTIGAHTVHHFELAKLSEPEAREEIERSADVLETRTGVRPRHVSYPIGGPASAGPREFALAEALGFSTAVTTRPGALYPEHAAHLTALPRISLNGLYQKRRYLDVFLTGAYFSMMGGGRLDVR